MPQHVNFRQSLQELDALLAAQSGHETPSTLGQEVSPPELTNIATRMPILPGTFFWHILFSSRLSAGRAATWILGQEVLGPPSTS